MPDSPTESRVFSSALQRQALNVSIWTLRDRGNHNHFKFGRREDTSDLRWISIILRGLQTLDAAALNYLFVSKEPYCPN